MGPGGVGGPGGVAQGEWMGPGGVDGPGGSGCVQLCTLLAISRGPHCEEEGCRYNIVSRTWGPQSVTRSHMVPIWSPYMGSSICNKVPYGLIT